MEHTLKLQFAFADLNKLNGIEWSNTVIFLKATGNVDDIKLISIKACISNEWLEFPTNKITVEDSYSIWQGVITTNSMLGKGPQDMEVCAYLEKYDGTTIYDNNIEANYIIPKGCGPYLFGDIKSFTHMEGLNMDVPKGNLMYCLKNNDIDKEIKIIYSYDKWESVHEKVIPFEDHIMISADNNIKQTNPTSTGLDFRRFQLDWDKGIKEIEYCIKIIDKDTEIWDNNNNLNYKGKIQEMPNLANLLNLDNLSDLGDFGLSDLFSSKSKEKKSDDDDEDEDDEEINTDDLFKALTSIKDIFSAMK